MAIVEARLDRWLVGMADLVVRSIGSSLAALGRSWVLAHLAVLGVVVAAAVAVVAAAAAIHQDSG